MNLLKKITFKTKTPETGTENRVEFYGELCEEGLNHYATYQEIKEAIVNEIVNRLEDDLSLTVEALKPEIAKLIKEQKTLKD